MLRQTEKCSSPNGATVRLHVSIAPLGFPIRETTTFQGLPPLAINCRRFAAKLAAVADEYAPKFICVHQLSPAFTLSLPALSANYLIA